MLNTTSPVARGCESESGKSLVETTIVFMMAGIVMAFSLPAVGNSISAYKLRGAANHLVERLSAARSLAMTRNKNVSLSLNKATGQYGFDFTTPSPDGVADYPGGPDHTTPSPDGVPDTRDPDDTTATLHPESLPDGIEVDFGDLSTITVTFNSRGELPIGSADREIEVEDETKSAVVRVNLRGKIWVQ